MSLKIYEPKILQVAFRFNIKTEELVEENEEEKFTPNGMVYYPNLFFKSLKEGVRENKNFLAERAYNSFFEGLREYRTVTLETEQHPEELAHNIVKRIETTRFVSNVGDIFSFFKVREDCIKIAVKDILENPDLYYHSAEKKVMERGFFGD